MQLTSIDNMFAAIFAEMNRKFFLLSFVADNKDGSSPPPKIEHSPNCPKHSHLPCIQSHPVLGFAYGRFRAVFARDREKNRSRSEETNFTGAGRLEDSIPPLQLPRMALMQLRTILDIPPTPYVSSVTSTSTPTVPLAHDRNAHATEIQDQASTGKSFNAPLGSNTESAQD
jgi:hypothetical protein